MPASSIAANGSVAARAAAPRASGAKALEMQQASNGAERQAAHAALGADAGRREAIEFGEPEAGLQ